MYVICAAVFAWCGSRMYVCIYIYIYTHTDNSPVALYTHTHLRNTICLIWNICRGLSSFAGNVGTLPGHIYTHYSPVVLYTHLFRFKVSFESRGSLTDKARVKWNVYIVRRANFEYICICVYMYICIYVCPGGSGSLGSSSVRKFTYKVTQGSSIVRKITYKVALGSSIVRKFTYKVALGSSIVRNFT